MNDRPSRNGTAPEADAVALPAQSPETIADSNPFGGFSIDSAGGLSSLHYLPVGLCFLVVLGGMAVGCVGGLVAARLTES